MCGWHIKRSDGASPRAVLLGALFTTLVLAGPGVAVAEDDEPDATVIVTDSRDPRATARQRPESAFTVLVDDAIPSTATAADVVEDVPGASIRRTGGPLDPSWVSIRGSSARQVAVYLDGVPLNAYGAAAVDLSQLPLHAYDRIEVFRGFAPPHLGSFSIGGAIDLVSDAARAPQPRFELSYGSWQTRRVAASGGLRHGAFTLRAHAAYAGTRGDFRTFSNGGTLYRDDDDRFLRRANNHRDRVSGLLSLSLDPGPVSLRLVAVPLVDLGGEPGAYLVETETASSRSLQNLLHGRARVRLGASELQLGLGWRVRYDRFRDPDGEIGLGRQDESNRYDDVNGDVSARLAPLPWLELRPSVRGQVLLHRTVDHRTGSDGPTHRRLALQGAFDARFLPTSGLEVRATVGVLALGDAADGKPRDAEQPVLVDVLPGLAVAARPIEPLTLRASVARAVRAPGFTELFGDRGSVAGNPDLRPERATQVDGGATLALGDRTVRGSVELGGYLRDTLDLIAYVPNGQNVAVPQNLGRTLVAGIESHGALSVGGHVEGRLGVTGNLGSRIVDGEHGTVGNRVPNVPLWQVDASLAFVWREHLRLQWSFLGMGGTYDSPSNLVRQADRPIHDLHLRVRPVLAGPWVALDVRNLFDTHVANLPRNPLRPSPDDVAPANLQDVRGQPLPGRSVMVTLGWSPAPRSESADR